MPVREFENGYWYVDELRDFGGRIGIPGAPKLRKDELERAIEAFLQISNGRPAHLRNSLHEVAG